MRVRLGPMTGPTADLDAVGSAIETLKSGGGTAIADAILSASEVMEHVDGRHIFVLFTDGYDEHSNAKLEEAMESVRRLHGTLYTVGINGAAGHVNQGARRAEESCRRHRRESVLPDAATKNCPSSTIASPPMSRRATCSPIRRRIS